MGPTNMVKVIDGKRYDTSKARMVCGDDWWDGHNLERHGRNRFLFRTARGNYFFQDLSQWQGEADTLVPCTVAEAMEFHHECDEHGNVQIPFEEAFPESVVEDA